MPGDEATKVNETWPLSSHRTQTNLGAVLNNMVLSAVMEGNAGNSPTHTTKEGFLGERSPPAPL